MTCKLLSFNKEDFSLIGSVFVSNICGHNLMNINNSLFFINNRSDSDLGNYFIFKLNENKDFTSYLPFSENIKSWSLDQYCAKGDSCGYFYFPPFDTIYIYKEENAYPKYFVNFGNDKMQNSIITGDPTDALLESSKSDKIIGINKIVPLECKMLINYTFNNGNYFTVYDIDNKNISTYKYVLNEKYQFPLNDVSRADDFLVADISAETFLFYYDIIIKENKMDANSLAEINRILNSINGESNPVLFFAKINN